MDRKYGKGYGECLESVILSWVVKVGFIEVIFGKKFEESEGMSYIDILGKSI